MIRIVVFGVALLGVLACDDAGEGSADMRSIDAHVGVDATSVDAGPLDAMLDARPFDAQPTDALVTDAMLTDDMLTDAMMTDAMMTDAMPTDAMLSDALPSDAMPPDALPIDGGEPARPVLKSSRLTWTAGLVGRGGPVLNFIGEAVRLRGRLLP